MSVNRGSESPELLNQLEVVVREQGTTMVIELAGEWDLADASAARDLIARVLTARPERVVLDLSRLAFIDSSGLHATLELANRLEAEDIGLIVVPGAPAVQRVFEMTGFTDRLPFIDKQPEGPRATRSRTAPDGAAGSGGFSLPPNGAGRHPQAAGVARSAGGGKPGM